MSRWKIWVRERINHAMQMRQGLQKQIDTLESSTVSCEKCGCLVLKENAVVGKPIIVNDGCLWNWGDMVVTPQHKIHTPYYCKLMPRKRSRSEK